jgi:hypothetical protein
VLHSTRSILLLRLSLLSCMVQCLECLLLDPIFAGLNPAEGDEFFRAIKIRSTPSYEGQVNSSAACHKILRHVKNY